MRANTALHAWRGRRQTIGAWLTLDSPLAAETLAHAGFDWLCVDMQHGVIDYDSTLAMLTAISTTETIPFVRVPWNDPATIMRVLDAGAYGVVVPLVNNAEEAERAVAACRYPPFGIRSAGPVRARLYGGDDYLARANDEIACIAMIETAEGIENLDAIAATPGLNAVYVGPTDLALALGLEPRGDHTDPAHEAEVARVLEVCQGHGIAAGIHTGSVAFTRKYLAMGFQMVTLGVEARWMEAGARADLDAARAP